MLFVLYQRGQAEGAYLTLPHIGSTLVCKSIEIYVAQIEYFLCGLLYWNFSCLRNVRSVRRAFLERTR